MLFLVCGCRLTPGVGNDESLYVIFEWCELCSDVLKIVVLINCSLEIFMWCLLNIVDLLSFYLQPLLKGGKSLYRWIKEMGIGVRQSEALGTKFIPQSA